MIQHSKTRKKNANQKKRDKLKNTITFFRNLIRKSKQPYQPAIY